MTLTPLFSQMPTRHLSSPSQNPQCHRRVKPHILSAVGDVALATGQAFKPQLELVLKILQEAANAQVDRVSWGEEGGERRRDREGRGGETGRGGEGRGGETGRGGGEERQGGGEGRRDR